MRAEQRNEVQYGDLLWRAVRRRPWLTLGLFLAVASPLSVSALLMEPRYESTGIVWVEEPRIPGFVESGRTDRLPALLTLLNSRNLAASVVDGLPQTVYNDLLRSSRRTDWITEGTLWVYRRLGMSSVPMSPREQVISELLKVRMEFTPKGTTGIVQVTAMASDPAIAAAICTAYIGALEKKTRSITQEESRSVREFLQNQAKQVERTLRQDEEALAQYERKRGVVKIDEHVTQSLDKLSQAEAALSDVILSEEIARMRLAAIKGQLEGRPAGKKVTDIIVVPVTLKDLFEGWRKAEATVVGLTQRYTDAHPAVRGAREEAQQLWRPLEDALQKHLHIAVSPNVAPGDRAALVEQALSFGREIGRLQAEREAHEQRVRILQAGLGSLSEDQRELTRRRQAVETNKTMYDLLNRRAGDENIRAQEGLRNVRILDSPAVPTGPSGRRAIKILLLGLLLGVGAAIGLPFGLELIDNTMKTEEDAESVFGWPVLGTVLAMDVRASVGEGRRALRALPAGSPREAPSQAAVPATRRLSRWWGRNGQRPGAGQRPEPPLCIVRHFDRMSPQAERYRSLRTALRLVGQRTPFRTLLVTSLGPKEGKSTTLVNLAVLFWELGNRVLVVDGDLRRGCLHRVFGVRRTPGLTDLILGKADTLFPAQELQPGFLLMTRGSNYDKPGVLLGSPAVQQAVAAFQEQADIILIDSSPVLPVSDVLNVVSMVDGVLLVVKAGNSARKDGLRARKLLEDAGANVLGLVLNGAKDTRLRGPAHHYADYYYGWNDDDPDLPAHERGQGAEELKRFS